MKGRLAGLETGRLPGGEKLFSLYGGGAWKLLMVTVSNDLH
jgi:hypothetical protein